MLCSHSGHTVWALGSKRKPGPDPSAQHTWEGNGHAHVDMGEASSAPWWKWTTVCQRESGHMSAMVGPATCAPARSRCMRQRGLRQLLGAHVRTDTCPRVSTQVSEAASPANRVWPESNVSCVASAAGTTDQGGDRFLAKPKTVET